MSFSTTPVLEGEAEKKSELERGNNLYPKPNVSQALCNVLSIRFSFNIHHEHVRSVTLFLLKIGKTLKRISDLSKGKGRVSGEEPCSLGFRFIPHLWAVPGLLLAAPDQTSAGEQSNRVPGVSRKVLAGSLGWVEGRGQHLVDLVLPPSLPTAPCTWKAPEPYFQTRTRAHSKQEGPRGQSLPLAAWEIQVML